MPRQSKAEVARERGFSLLTAELSAAGYEREPGLAYPTFLSGRSTLFGRGGVEFISGVEPSRGGNAWVFEVNVILYDRTSDEVVSGVLGSDPGGSHAATVLVSLMELVRNEWRDYYRVEVFGPDQDLAQLAALVVGDVEKTAEDWFAIFDDRQRAYDFLCDEPTLFRERNHMAGMVAALKFHDQVAIERFARTLGQRWTAAVNVDLFRSQTRLYRGLGEQYGVELPLVTWDEVRARGDARLGWPGRA